MRKRTQAGLDSFCLVANHAVTVTGTARDAQTGEIARVYIANSSRWEPGNAFHDLTAERVSQQLHRHDKRSCVYHRTYHGKVRYERVKKLMDRLFRDGRLTMTKAEPTALSRPVPVLVNGAPAERFFLCTNLPVRCAEGSMDGSQSIPSRGGFSGFYTALWMILRRS